MEQIAIVCASITGNTAMLAKALQRHFPEKCIGILPPEKADPNICKRYFVGSWTDKGSCSVETSDFLEQLSNKEIFLFGTCGFGCSKDYCDLIIKHFSDHLNDTNKITGSFMCQGKMPEVVLKRYQKMKEANPDCVRWQESIDNYYKALNHPNEEDIVNLCLSAEKALAESN